MPQVGAAQFRAAAQALNDAGDKALRREVYAAFRRAARPLGERVLKEGSGGLPKRGGLSARVAAAKIGQSNSTTGRNPGVALTFRTAAGASGKSMDLKSIDAGIVRHPVFFSPGRTKTWRVTRVAPALFSTPFNAGKEPVAKEVVAAMEKVAQEIAARTNKGGGR